MLCRCVDVTFPQGQSTELVFRIGRYQFEKEEYGGLLNYAVANAAVADNIFERLPKRSLTVESLRDHACAPIDPLYGMEQNKPVASRKLFW
jgi:hypothetical protein